MCETAHSGTASESLHLNSQQSACQSNPAQVKREAVRQETAVMVQNTGVYNVEGRKSTSVY